VSFWGSQGLLWGRSGGPAHSACAATLTLPAAAAFCPPRCDPSQLCWPCCQKCNCPRGRPSPPPGPAASAASCCARPATACCAPGAAAATTGAAAAARGRAPSRRRLAGTPGSLLTAGKALRGRRRSSSSSKLGERGVLLRAGREGHLHGRRSALATIGGRVRQSRPSTSTARSSMLNQRAPFAPSVAARRVRVVCRAEPSDRVAVRGLPCRARGGSTRILNNETPFASKLR